MHTRGCDGRTDLSQYTHTRAHKGRYVFRTMLQKIASASVTCTCPDCRGPGPFVHSFVVIVFDVLSAPTIIQFHCIFHHVSRALLIDYCANRSIRHATGVFQLIHTSGTDRSLRIRRRKKKHKKTQALCCGRVAVCELFALHFG